MDLPQLGQFITLAASPHNVENAVMNQKTKRTDQQQITLESLYPTFSPAEIAKVEVNLERYLQLMLRMHARLTESRNESYAHLPTLTA